MREITIVVPDALSELPGEERDLLLGRALRSVAKERIAQVESEVEEGLSHIRAFEKKYNMAFGEYEKKIESLEFFGVEYQEDYHDWYFWNACTLRSERVLQGLKQFVAP